MVFHKSHTPKTSLKGRRRVRIKRFTSSQASRLASRLLALENALFPHFSSSSNPKISDPLAQARILQPLGLQSATSRPGETTLAQARQLSLRRANSRSSESNLAQARILQYSPVFHSPRVSHLILQWLPNNGFTFYKKKQDDQSKMKNNGVAIVTRTLHMSSVKDKNPI
ncbi:hypothetical protein Lal_00033297 [Lupinus albus]|nr:hypothetical protein Lal_00033297 [Lupinus albus]